MKQLDAYAEDKYEDEEDLREQARSIGLTRATPNERIGEDGSTSQLLHLQQTYPDIFPQIRAVLNTCEAILQRYIDW